MRVLAAAAIVVAALSGLLAPAIALADSSVPKSAGGASLVMASLERTACYGRCPIYTVTVLRDGTVTWQGRRFVKVVGSATAKLPARTVAALAAAFRRADFFALADRYDHRDVTDNPSAITTFSDGTRTKKIDHYYGDESAPAALRELEARVDELAGTARWVGQVR
jgi:hypothetical protein